MASDEEPVCGMTITEQLRFLAALAPLISYGQRFLVERDAYKRTLIVSDAITWLTSNTAVEFDDTVAKLVADVLKTDEGEALVRGILELVTGDSE